MAKIHQERGLREQTMNLFINCSLFRKNGIRLVAYGQTSQSVIPTDRRTDNHPRSIELCCNTKNLAHQIPGHMWRISVYKFWSPIQSEQIQTVPYRGSLNLNLWSAEICVIAQLQMEILAHAANNKTELTQRRKSSSFAYPSFCCCRYEFLSWKAASLAALPIP